MEEKKNIFEETVKTLKNDALSLQQKLTVLQEKNDFRGSIDVMRLLKDTLSLIKEYDWQTMYSEYRTDGKKQVSVWEQNHCGEIRNHKVWDVSDRASEFYNRWIEQLENSILTHGKDSIIYYSDSDFYRGSGKSYALAKLCDKYNGVFVCENNFGFYGIENNCEKFKFSCNCINYRESFIKEYSDKIIFIDENSDLTKEQVNKIAETHTVVGFLRV